MTASREMPRYRCHKEVWALKIKDIEQADTAESLPGGSWRLVVEDEGYAPVIVAHDWVTKHGPQKGGYFVVYDDGYRSYSPAQAFESGYTLKEPQA